MENSLDFQRAEYLKRRFTAMPIAGAIVWFVLIFTGLFLEITGASLAIFFGTGIIVYLGIFISRFTGENFTDRDRPKNDFDMMFYATTFQALLVYSIAIPFFLIEPSSLPLSVGILSGLMWIPLSWAISHWIGIFHAVVRTGLIVALWYVFPDWRYVTIPIAIVVVYAITLVVLEMRWREVNAAG